MLIESFPGTCPAGVSLSALELFWHLWVPPHDLAPINKKILSCEVPLLGCVVCADCPLSAKLPDPRKNTSHPCFPPSDLIWGLCLSQPGADAGCFS